jgi:ParB-like chromosome segregation protein Spo0J
MTSGSAQFIANRREGIFDAAPDQFELDLERLRRPRDAAIKKMVGSLKKRGQLTPVIAVENERRFTLVDGFKRYHAAVKLCLPALKTVCIEADAKQAKAMMYLLNRSGGFTMIQEALLVRELIDSEGLTQTEAGILLDRHKSWISRRLDMVRRLAPQGAYA